MTALICFVWAIGFPRSSGLEQVKRFEMIPADCGATVSWESFHSAEKRNLKRLQRVA